jgi:hypothetical protein
VAVPQPPPSNSAVRGLADPGHRLADAAAAAFMYSLTGACLVAAGVAAGGVLLRGILAPRPPAC